MDEFIKNLNEFKEWLYEQENKAYEYGNIEAEDAYNRVVNKFEELKLDTAFQPPLTDKSIAMNL